MKTFLIWLGIIFVGSILLQTPESAASRLDRIRKNRACEKYLLSAPDVLIFNPSSSATAPYYIVFTHLNLKSAERGDKFRAGVIRANIEVNDKNQANLISISKSLFSTKPNGYTIVSVNRDKSTFEIVARRNKDNRTLVLSGKLNGSGTVTNAEVIYPVRKGSKTRSGQISTLSNE